MSMQSSFIYGFGFHCECNDTNLIEFIKSHKISFCKSQKEMDLYEDMLHYTEKEYDLENYFETYSCDENGIEGPGSVIANIMSRETGIRFIYCLPDETCDTSAAIVFSEGYPWEMNNDERNLTEESLSDICRKYMNELGIINEEPRAIALEYFG